MKRNLITAFAIFVLAGGAVAVAASSEPSRDGASRAADESASHGATSKTILAFDAMYGVDGPFLEEKNAIHGIAGDELPWEIEGYARGRLDSDGHLTIRIRGLVFTDDPSVPRELRGINDESHFRGLVSCLSETKDEGVEVVNVVTRPFPATRSGNSNIVTTVDLPESCIAPIVMVLAGSEDKWFAITGFESEEDDDGDDED